MFYDITVFALAVSGVAGVLVYSYKIFRSRVYVVGIVHEKAKPSVIVPQDVATDMLPRGIAEEPVGIEVVFALPEKWCSCERCGMPQKLDPEFPRCKICGHALELAENSDRQLISVIEERYERIETELSEQQYSLKAHHKVVMDMEKRIRQLERESVRFRVPGEVENAETYNERTSVQ